MGEITIILLLAMIFLGPKKLPELASGLGKLIREIRKTTSDVKNEIQLDDAIRKPFEELRDAVTLHPDELKRRDRLRRDLADLQKRAQESIDSAPAEPAPAEEATAGEGATPDESAGSVQGAVLAPEGTSAEAEVSGPDAATRPTAALDEGAAASAVAPDQTASMVTPAPVLVVPAVPGAAPVGTVAREPLGTSTPPAPPLAAVLAKGSGPVAGPDRRVAVPPTGSDFLRSLRAVPEPRKPIPGRPAAEPLGAADRSNTTQTLTEADLAAITVGPPPPPPGPGSGRTTPPPPPPSPRLPGATPPKNPNQ
jgi:Sec-independent protein translocase protein TatA